MSLVTTKEMFNQSLQEGFGIGAFNIYNMEVIQAIVDAASETRSPVILQVSPSAIRYAGIKYLVNLVNTASEIYPDIPIVLHLDHGLDFETCKMCIDEGFTSVMIDGSSLDFDKNVELTKKVVDYAHSKGVVVEAELGKLEGVEDDVNISTKDSSYTNPTQALEFVTRTGCDSLAISIGTSHGAYKNNGVVNLRFDILKEIKELLPNTPLVLHGASTVESSLVDMCNKYDANIIGAVGVDEEVLKEACKMGISKINVDTDLRLATTAGIRKIFFENPSLIDPRNYLSVSRDLMKNLVKQKIENIFCSNNKV